MVIERDRPDYGLAGSEALRLLRANDVQEPPVDVVSISRAEGVKVIFATFDARHNHISGFYDFQENAIFVNQDEWPLRQTFTIAHELAHVWLGSGSAFNLLNLQPFDDDGEKYCDMVAAEFLVPEVELRDVWREAGREAEPFKFLSRRFKVSPIVVARRALDLAFISRDRFFEFYTEYKDDQDERIEQRKKAKKRGGNFYNTQNVRIGKRFASAVYRAAKEGRLLYRDAYRLTGLHGNTFDNYFRKLGIA